MVIIFDLFWIKMALLLFAILIHFAVVGRRIAAETGTRLTWGDVILAGLSLTRWF
jgi:hypothetical protein